MAGSLPGTASAAAFGAPGKQCAHCLRPALLRYPVFSCRQRLAHSTAPEARAAGFATCSAAAVEAPALSADSLPSRGPDLWNRTYYPTGEDANPQKKLWYVVDAEGQTLGRLATMVAMHIRGKTVATYQPSMDMGAYVVVVNAEKVVVSGNKAAQKIYTRHTGRPGSRKEETFAMLQKRIPERIVELAVKGMLPKGRLGRHLFTHLKVYKGAAHPHSAQKPADITAKINKNAAESAAAVPI